MGTSNKPYKCEYCGRQFKKPTAHKCKGGFRKHKLKFQKVDELPELTKWLLEPLDIFFGELPPIPQKGKREVRFCEPPKAKPVAEMIDDAVRNNKDFYKALDDVIKKYGYATLPDGSHIVDDCTHLPQDPKGCSFREMFGDFLTEEDAHKSESPLSTQVGGDHYKKYKIQPIEFAMANGLDACQTNIIKYLLRHKDKNGKEDLLKARHYLD